MPSEIARLRECVLEQVEYKRGECFSFSTGVLEGKPVVFGEREGGREGMREREGERGRERERERPGGKGGRRDGGR